MTSESRSTVTVVIASVGRPLSLAESLRAIELQSDRPDRVMVVSQEADTSTQEVARTHHVDLVIVDRPGLALAVEAGIAAATTDVVSFVDDDATAFPDWVASIRQAFAENPKLGVLGGRDNVDADRTSGSADLTVGQLSCGRIIGNHHLGMGTPRPAVHVKGANMSVRRLPASRVPLERLVAGRGAQVRNEFILCLGILSQGFEGRYDPGVQVDHFPAARAAGDERTRFSRERTKIVRHNETVALALFRARWVIPFVVRAVLVGDRNCYGLAYLILRALQGERGAVGRFQGSVAGIVSGLRVARSEREALRPASANQP